jgi:peptidoglycan hydrolase-like protein with peptidoglycan-binding domain
MNIKTKIVAALALAVFVVPGISMAQTMSVAQLQQEIQSLTAQLTQLEAQLTAAGGTTTAWCYTFNNNLSIGMSGSAITALQTAIQKDGESVTVNGTFDDQTAAAVTTFQQKYQSAILAPYGLSNGTGYAGKGTRTELNSLFGCGTGSTPIIPTPTPITPVTPSVSSIQITSPTAGQSFSYGSTMNIQWTPASVGVAEILLVPTTGGSSYSIYGMKVFGNPTNYSGSYSASLNGISAGSYYVEVYSALDSNDNGTGVMGQSGVITIASAAPTPVSVNVTSPTAGQTFANGSTMNIQWTPASAGVAVIQLVSTSGGESPIVYANKVDGDPVNYSGSYSLVVPWGYSGSYYVRLMNPENDQAGAGNPMGTVIGQSGSFTITAPVTVQQAPTITNLSSNQGTATSSITIYGTNLTSGGNPTIQFYSSNGTLAGTINSVSMGYISPQSIVFTPTVSNSLLSALSPGTYQIDVLTPAGTSNSESFTLLAPVVQAPVINSFSVGAGPTFSLSAYNYNTITFQAQCGNFVAVVQPQNGSPTLYPTGSASICNAPQTYSSSSFNETSSIAPQMVNVPLSLYNAQGVVDGSITMVGSPAGSNNSGSASLTVNVCNSAGVCVQQTASFPIYAKG